MFNDRRGLLARAFDICLGILIAAVLLHLAVVLLLDVLWWLIGGVAIAVLGGLAWHFLRARSERW